MQINYFACLLSEQFNWGITNMHEYDELMLAVMFRTLLLYLCTTKYQN